MNHLGCRLHPREILTTTTALESCRSRSSNTFAEAKRPHSILHSNLHIIVWQLCRRSCPEQLEMGQRKESSCGMPEKTYTDCTVLPLLRCIMLLVRTTNLPMNILETSVFFLMGRREEEACCVACCILRVPRDQHLPLQNLPACLYPRAHHNSDPSLSQTHTHPRLSAHSSYSPAGLLWYSLAIMTHSHAQTHSGRWHHGHVSLWCAAWPQLPHADPHTNTHRTERPLLRKRVRNGVSWDDRQTFLCNLM